MEHPHDLTLYVASGAILAAPLVASVMERSRGWIFVSREPLVSASVVIKYGLALLSLGAGAIHLAASTDHYAESLVAGVLMSAVGWFQLLWPAIMLASARRSVHLAAIAVNAATVVAWLASRTVGAPIPFGDGGVEPVGALDLLATSLEMLILVGLAVVLGARRRLQAASISSRSASLSVGALAAIVIVAVSSSIGAGVPHGH